MLFHGTKQRFKDRSMKIQGTHLGEKKKQKK
uniref:Uncharacterized protein n=1 Tax=Rhizophora mucronata TaxID=61149 RepID=A0A2P2NA85_RHIMU